jgi:hypothetical protein
MTMLLLNQKSASHESPEGARSQIAGTRQVSDALSCKDAADDYSTAENRLLSQTQPSTSTEKSGDI